MLCPRCNGPMWDNRQDKKNPKAPDFKCKNTNCVDDKGFVTAVWEKKEAPKSSKFTRSPEDQKSIVRQHSQEMALRFAELKEMKSISQLDLVKIIDWFELDANGGHAKVAPQTPMEVAREMSPADDVETEEGDLSTYFDHYEEIKRD